MYVSFVFCFMLKYASSFTNLPGSPSTMLNCNSFLARFQSPSIPHLQLLEVVYMSLSVRLFLCHAISTSDFDFTRGCTAFSRRPQFMTREFFAMMLSPGHDARPPTI